MVQILPQEQSFGSLLGAGLSQGIGQGLDAYFKQKQEAAKDKQLMDMINAYQQGEQPQQIGPPQDAQYPMAQGAAQSPLMQAFNVNPALEGTMAQGLGQIGGTETSSPIAQQLGQQTQLQEQPVQPNAPSQQQQTRNPQQQERLLAAIAAKNPAIAKVLQQGQQARTDAELKLLSLNEPQLLQLGKETEKLEEDALRFSRLEALQATGKMPNHLLVGAAQALSKDGELNPGAYALLSPEAQEISKLLADMISGAKDTFGARVTNFDLQSFMKRLPSLLNSPDGFKAVLRDLSIINQINQLHNASIWEGYDALGGPGRTTHSAAIRKGKAFHLKEINALKREFVHPSSTVSSTMPDIGSEPKGTEITDSDTGEKWVSDGKQWVKIS